MLELSRARFKTDKNALHADISQWAGSISFVSSHVLNVFLFGHLDNNNGVVVDGSNSNGSCDGGALVALSPYVSGLLSEWLSKQSIGDRSIGGGDPNSRDSIGSIGSFDTSRDSLSIDSVMQTLLQVFFHRFVLPVLLFSWIA
jgi:hypothetical protein